MQSGSRFYKPPTKRQIKRISKYLSSNEKLYVVTSIGMRYFWICIVALFIAPLIAFYIAVFIFLGILKIPAFDWIKYFGILALIILISRIKKTSTIFRRRQSFAYVLTSRRFLIVSGILSRKIVTAPLDAITHITIEQSFLQRFVYNTGHLIIITAGFDQREIVIENIASPVKFKIFIEELSGSSGDNAQSRGDGEVPKLRALTF